MAGLETSSWDPSQALNQASSQAPLHASSQASVQLGSPQIMAADQMQGIRAVKRSFTLPARLINSGTASPYANDDSSAKETLLHVDSARIAALEAIIPSWRANSIAESSDASEDQLGIRCNTPSDITLDTGPLRIYRVTNTGISFLNSRTILKPILPKTQCWCVEDDDTKFVLRVRENFFYRIDLPSYTQVQKDKIDEFKRILGQLCLYEKTPCPFKKGYYEAEERRQIPMRKASSDSKERVMRWRLNKIWEPEDADRRAAFIERNRRASERWNRDASRKTARKSEGSSRVLSDGSMAMLGYDRTTRSSTEEPCGSALFQPRSSNSSEPQVSIPLNSENKASMGKSVSWSSHNNAIARNGLRKEALHLNGVESTGVADAIFDSTQGLSDPIESVYSPQPDPGSDAASQGSSRSSFYSFGSNDATTQERECDVSTFAKDNFASVGNVSYDASANRFSSAPSQMMRALSARYLDQSPMSPTTVKFPASAILVQRILDCFVAPTTLFVDLVLMFAGQTLQGLPSDNIHRPMSIPGGWDTSDEDDDEEEEHDDDDEPIWTDDHVEPHENNVCSLPWKTSISTR